MSIAEANPLESFQWERQPEAEALVRALVGAFLEKNQSAAAFAEKLSEEAGVRLVDLVDYLAVPATDAMRARLDFAGFARDEAASGVEAFVHSGGIFPRIVLRDGSASELAIKVESVADFAAVHATQNQIEGPPLGLYRRLCVNTTSDTCFAVVERHGYRGFAVPPFDHEKAIARLAHLEAFRARRREFNDDGAGFEHAVNLIDAAIADIGVHVTCDLFFAAEREYWQRRNRAAQVQKYRQDKLGIGWANHDHHTYRSSRQQFRNLIAVWEKLGLYCRERFYAGREAGWGAQVMEQPVTGIITFNDVDLSPEELMGDFSHDGLAPRDNLGTVGLWCALHGEAFLQAGMHHLEGQFDFEGLRQQLARDAGVNTMKPFTDFTYLRQAFTEGERWAVSHARIERALRAGYITEEQARQFREQGAIGSHLENLERNEGFKGFNQTGVSEIIAATDPRKQVRALHV